MSGPDPDELLLGRLRQIAAVVDPVPPDLVRIGRESLTWRRVDAELAELLSDSALEDERLGLVRSGGGVRSVTFATGELTIELDIQHEDGRRTLIGQLVPPGPASIEVQTRSSSATVGADELGRFRSEGVPAGPVRLRVTGAAGSPVETSWLAA